MQILGVPAEKVIVGTFETRRFQQFRQEILEYMLKIRNSFNPDIVFVHTRADLHQDHSTVTEEGLRAFRGTTVLGYDVIRSSYGFFPHFLVEVNESDVNAKIRALNAYHTYADKYYFDPELTRSILVKNGALAERKFAEGFDILRIIGAFGCV
jgi:LmbE family N-acetylglucosaminyl deacetylase